ncbi:MAG: 16S rRNA (cytidine(1402)-2'-O)-methyltransferase [Acidiferrobacterales bacterium]
MVNIAYKVAGRVSKGRVSVSNKVGVLYVVATPIGNLADITHRAVQLLSKVDLIAAEDTRHARKLLHHFGVATKMIAFHDHNELSQIPKLLGLLHQGKCIALVSDAGTPLISDPGFKLVCAVHTSQIPVVPVPGPCAAIAALSVAGLPTDSFAFDGFPPSKAVARAAFFAERQRERRTLVFYESPHRLMASLRAMADAFGKDRPAVLARELTKKFETIRHASLGELCDWVAADKDQQRGEFVVIVGGARLVGDVTDDTEAERVVRILLHELPVKQAATLAAEITNQPRRRLYRLALDLADD